MDAYAPIWEAREKSLASRPGGRGNPEATGPAILEIVDAEEPPLRCFFGAGTLDMIRAEYQKRLDTWEKWDRVAVEAHGLVTR
jgi:hypothetical protein